MEVKEVIVSRSLRVNLGNYESVEHYLCMKADVDPELDTVEGATAELTALVERAAVAQLVRSYKVRGKKLSPTEVAKHHGLSYVPKEG